MTIRNLSKDKVQSRLSEEVGVMVFDRGGLVIHDRAGGYITITAEGQERLLNTLLAAKAGRGES